MSVDAYRVLAASVEAEIEVKRSRFLARLARVEDEQGARAVVEEARRRHHDAGHHCSAFVLGADGQVERSNDDGEPSGTAGTPMLDVLRGAGLSDVVAVVSRWFGGTLLGTGGLARAYGDAVRTALEGGRVVTRKRVTRVGVEVSPAEVGRLENDLRSRDLRVVETRYDATATIILDLTSKQMSGVDDLLATLTSGRVHAVEMGERWSDPAP